MPSTPHISVLLPVWNAAKTLGTCLRSVQRQRARDFECLILDDGSDDGSVGLAREVARSDPRFRVLAGPHRGLVETLNLGTEHCRGNIIARMDADDWMHRDRLALQIEMLNRDPTLDAVGCWPRIFPRRRPDANAKREGRREYERWLNSLGDADLIWRDRFIECPVAHPTLAIRREALVSNPYRDRDWPEDYDLILRLLRRGPCVGIVPRTLLGWRDHPNRLSRTDGRYSLEQFTACRAHHLSRDFLGGRPSYTLWGYGKTGRTLRRALETLEHGVARIVDVHPRRIGQVIGGAKVIPPEALSAFRTDPIIVSVAGEGPREQIRTWMHEMNFREGSDFVMAA